MSAKDELRALIAQKYEGIPLPKIEELAGQCMEAIRVMSRHDAMRRATIAETVAAYYVKQFAELVGSAKAESNDSNCT